ESITCRNRGLVCRGVEVVGRFRVLPPSWFPHGWSPMTPYPPDVEQAMKTFGRSLREHDRRRYAAVEAAKLGHGGVEYIAHLLGLTPNTIRQGRRDLQNLPDPPPKRVRRPGGGRKRRVAQ